MRCTHQQNWCVTNVVLNIENCSVDVKKNWKDCTPHFSLLSPPWDAPRTAFSSRHGRDHPRHRKEKVGPSRCHANATTSSECTKRQSGHQRLRRETVRAPPQEKRRRFPALTNHWGQRKITVSSSKWLGDTEGEMRYASFRYDTFKKDRGGRGELPACSLLVLWASSSTPTNASCYWRMYVERVKLSALWCVMSSLK